MFSWITDWLIRRRFHVLLTLTCVFLLMLYPSTDPDLGWHLRYGREIWETGKIASQDNFSWSMPGYRWFNFSWFFDAVVYLLFSRYGFFALALLNSIILVFSFFFLIKPFRLSFLQQVFYAIIFISFLEPMSSVGLRSQQFTILGIALLNFLFIFINRTRGYVYCLFFPLICAVWVNLHGSVSLGIAMIVLFAASQSVVLIADSLFENRKLSLKPLSLLILSSFSSVGFLLMPFLGSDIVRQIADYVPSKIPSGVSEWMPVFMESDIWLLIFGWAFVNAFLVFKQRKERDALYWAGTSILFSYLAFDSRRMVGPYFVVTMPLVLRNWQQKRLSDKLSTASLVALFFSLAMIVNGLAVRAPDMKFFQTNWTDYCADVGRCSLKAADYLKKHPVPTGMLNYYDFGGYTVWFNPETKVFIDGRMHLWNQDGYSAYLDHDRIFFKDDYALFNKYNFKAVYLPVGMKLYNYLKRQTGEGKWKLAFEDGMAAIFVRNE